MKIEKENLSIIGDIHGEISFIVYEIVERLKIRDTAFIIVGDVGLGFEKSGYYDQLYKRISGKLEKSGNILYGIRGNHDDPEYFNGSLRLDYPHFKTIPDYEIIEWGDRTILPIGGATSLDLVYRLTLNAEYRHVGSSKRVWWEGERPEQRNILEIRHPDIIVSHEAPLGIGPVSNRPAELGEEIYADMLDDRRYLASVLHELTPVRWYFGHHHKTYSGTLGETLYRGLDINEIIDVKL